MCTSKPVTRGPSSGAHWTGRRPGDALPEEAGPAKGCFLHLPDKGPSDAQRKLSRWDTDLEGIVEALPVHYITCFLS